MAPEMLSMKPYDQSYDVYSLGILLFEMLVGRTPFQGANRNNIVKLVNEGIVFPESMNSIEQDLVRNMTRLDPK